MLIEKQKVDISILKLCNGDEVIAKVIGTNDQEYTVENPFVLIMAQQGMQFSPMLIMGDPESEVQILRASVVAKAKPAKGMLTGYESATSKIAMPQKQGIIV